MNVSHCLFMNITIQLDAQIQFIAIKIQHVRPYGMLPTESESCTAPSEVFPQHGLCSSHVTA